MEGNSAIANQLAWHQFDGSSAQPCTETSWNGKPNLASELPSGRQRRFRQPFKKIFYSREYLLYFRCKFREKRVCINFNYRTRPFINAKCSNTNHAISKFDSSQNNSRKTFERFRAKRKYLCVCGFLLVSSHERCYHLPSLHGRCVLFCWLVQWHKVWLIRDTVKFWLCLSLNFYLMFFLNWDYGQYKLSLIKASLIKHTVCTRRNK